MQRKIEGVWNGETFEIQDMFANRADVYASNAATAALLTLDPEPHVALCSTRSPHNVQP